MAIPAIHLQDCQLITNTFKKGCHASVSEGATFAVLTSNVQFMQSMAKTISKQMSADNEDSLASLTKQAAKLGGGLNLKAAEKKEEGLFTRFENAVPDDLFKDSILNGIAECLPCNFIVAFAGGKKEFRQRIQSLKELNLKKILMSVGEELLATMKAWLIRALSQLKNLIEMLKNLDKYTDLCDFIKFFQDFICIPDLARILALLSAFLMDLSFELNSIMDLAFSLIVPLFMPFLTNLLDSIMKYILLIIKPIECVIDSIQNMLSKLDYNVLFKNTERLGKINSKEAVGEVKVPFIGAFSVQDPTGVPLVRKTGAFFGQSWPESDGQTDYKPINVAFDFGQRAQVLKEEERIRLAAKQLEAIKKASASVDGANPDSVAKYKEQERRAVEEYRDAIKDRDMSAIGKANQALSGFKNQLKGSFLQLVNLLREICQKVDAWFRSLFDEFKKLLGQYENGSGFYIDFASKKLAIIQFIAFINSILKALTNGLDCNEKDLAVETFLSSVPNKRQFKIWNDGEDINIEEVPGNLGDAIDKVAMAYSKNPSGSPMEKLKSLIEYTGDPMIDKDIADAVDRLTVPGKLVFSCSSRTKAADASKLNDYIASLENA